MDIRKFKDADENYSPSVIWDWCAKPTPEEIDEKLSSFSDMGIKTIFIRPSKGLALPYLSQDYFELIRTAARRSAKYGVSLWICDENSPSSGNGGGEITSVADYRVRDFIKTDKNNTEKTDTLISEEDGSIFVLRDMASVRASKRERLADISNLFVTECFTQEVYDKYLKECKRFIGCEIKGFLTHINIPDDAVPYFPAAQKMLDGSSLAESAGSLTEKNKDFSKKYYSAVSCAIADNFTKIIREKCNKSSLSIGVGVNGKKEISRQLQYINADRISLEVSFPFTNLLQIKLAETICAQFKKPLTARLLLPLFAPCSDRFAAASFLCGMGAENICYDSVAFSLSDRRKYEKHTVALSKFCEKDISDRISRLCFISKGTLSKADILLLYSAENEEYFSGLVKNLLNQGVSFHIAENDVFEKYACVSADSIDIGSCTYSAIISDCDVPSFSGTKFIIDDMNIVSDFSCFLKGCKISSDKEVIINRRTDGINEYIFITASEEPVEIKAVCDKKLYAADSSNGEIYLLPSQEDTYTFTLNKNKTVLIISSDDINADIIPPFTDEIIINSHKKKTELPFVLASAGENILPLKEVNACFGRKSYRDNNIDSLHKEFYALANNETVKVKYPFTAELNKIGTVKAYIENADNLEFAELNGKPLADFMPSEKDLRFMGVDITKLLANGKNTLALEYKKQSNYNPDFSSFTPMHFSSFNITSFEPVYLCGDFDVSNNLLTQLEEYENNVMLCGMPYYYGALTYAVKLPESELANTQLIIHGNFDICKIKIDKREFTFFSESPVTELFNLDCGAVAEITIFNTPYNLMRTADQNAQPFGIEKVELSTF